MSVELHTPERLQPVITALRDRFEWLDSGMITGHRGEVTIELPRERLVEVCTFLRDDPATRFEHLSDLSGTDYLGWPAGRPADQVGEPPTPPPPEGRPDLGPARPPRDSQPQARQPGRLCVDYHLYSFEHNVRLRLKVRVTVEDPHIPTVTGVWPTGNFHEREVYDFFGVRFDGHPNLIRILMPEDWRGYPLRKDYPLGGVDIDYHGAHITPPETRSYKGGWTSR